MTQRRKRRATEAEKQAARRRGEAIPVWVYADTGTIAPDSGSYGGGSSYDSGSSGCDSGSSSGSSGGCD